MIPNIDSKEIQQIFFSVKQLSKKELFIVCIPSLILIYLFVITLWRFPPPVTRSC